MKTQASSTFGSYVPTQPGGGPPPYKRQKPNNLQQQPSTSNNEEHLQSVRTAREQLPVFGVRKELLEHIRGNHTCIVIGETGCGKSTQIPQFVLEERLNEGALIAVTQPRRVAAVTLAGRVGDERRSVARHADGRDAAAAQIGYSVRFEQFVGDKTQIVYMTDGILLREAIFDPTLKRYSVIVLDEAHERTLHTDIMFGVVKEAQKRRSANTMNLPQLKVIVMSATMDVDHFASYFDEAPVLHIEGRTHPVKIYYMPNDDSLNDYLHNTLVTVFQIHQDSKSCEDVLVFLTGQEEIETIVSKTRQLAKQLHDRNPDLPKLLPMGLYAQMSPAQQHKVFVPSKQGVRKVIFATNIAETSLTIPGIGVVIDCGKVKSRIFDARSRLNMLMLVKVSKAQAKQRTGRAGRDAPGRCFRLYSEDLYRKLDDTTKPEILRCSVTAVLLELLRMGISDIGDFDFMDPPKADAVKQALDELTELQAIESDQDESRISTTDDEEQCPNVNYFLTEIGKELARFPLEPRHAMILIAAAELGCLEECLTIVAAMSHENIFINSAYTKNQEACLQAQGKFHAVEGDHLTMLNVIRAYKNANTDEQSKRQWCSDNFVIHRNLDTVLRIRTQLRQICVDAKLKLQSSGRNTTPIRRALCRGLFLNSAQLSAEQTSEGGAGQFKLLQSSVNVKIHPSSVLSGKRPGTVVYSELVMTSAVYIRDVTVVDPKWLKDVAPSFARNVHDM